MWDDQLMGLVQNGERFPDVNGFNAENEAVSLVDMAAGQWTAVLFYRGHW